MIIHYISNIGLIILIFALELFFYRKTKDKVLNLYWTRFNVLLMILVAYLLFSIIMIQTLNIDELQLSFWIAVILVVYVIITEFVMYEKVFNIRLVRKSKWLVILISSLSCLIFFFIFSAFNMPSGLLFASADWFSLTFMTIVRNEDMYAIIALEVIGGLVIIIAKSRRSSSFATAGFFLIIGLPIFSVMDSIFTNIDEIEIIAPELLSAFQNEAIAVIVYTIVLLIFYILITSVIIAFTSMMDSVTIDD